MPGTRILTTFIYTRQCRVRALKGLSDQNIREINGYKVIEKNNEEVILTLNNELEGTKEKEIKLIREKRELEEKDQQGYINRIEVEKENYILDKELKDSKEKINKIEHKLDIMRSKQQPDFKQIKDRVENILTNPNSEIPLKIRN
jgi:hypothetical protein